MKRTTTEAELREFAAKGLDSAEIAAVIGFPTLYVRHAFAVLGIANNDHEDILEQMRMGYTLNEIAQSHGISVAGLHKRLRTAGLPTNARALRRAEAAQANQA